MHETRFNSREAAAQLGISVLTLYDWLSQSDAGRFAIRGEQTTIHYFQGGRNGQGRIQITRSEVERLLSLMIVRPTPVTRRQSPLPRQSLQHITARPGRPDD